MNGTFPGTWKQSIIVPIPKSGKDKSNPQNYRPIALTNCLCKTMERMINCRLPMFIKNILFERTFRVRVGSTFLDSQHQKESVPQGSILSVTLFSIKINNIVKCLTPSIDCAFYVDDFVIRFRATHMNIVERQLQLNLNKINK